MNKNMLLVFVTFLAPLFGVAQMGIKGQIREDGFVIEKNNPVTEVKDQAYTNTCWSFSTTSLIESQFLKNNGSAIDLSEMFTVYNIYLDKARNYILRQGKTQFSEGGLGHDVIHAIATYGAVPESVYNGLKPEEKTLNHSKLIMVLKEFLDNTLKSSPFNVRWMDEYRKILDENIGNPPAEFDYMGKKYSPKSFAVQILKFNPNDYVNISSFTHHPFYATFIPELPDNYSNGSYYNLPLNEMISLVKNALTKGYTVLWDADVSNSGFYRENGLGLFVNNEHAESASTVVSADMEELPWSVSLRQQYFESLVTQDDHLMHITGLEKSKKGKTFFIVKNSWGKYGPYNGYVNISEAYFAMNTISLVVPKDAIDKMLLLKLGIK